MDLLEKYYDDIAKLCVQHKVKSLYAFGSVLTDKFNNQSDIDFLVDFSNISLEDYADNYFDLKFSLQDTLKRPIDLLEEKAIKNPYFKQVVSQQKKLVYGHWKKVWLYDILTAINEIESYYVDQKKDFLVFQNDTKTKRAIERNIEIIGEAMNRIFKKDPSIAVTKARKLVDVRNRIIQG